VEYAAGDLQIGKFPASVGVILELGLRITRVAMTPTVAELLAQKQQLLERLQGELPGLSEQDEIERLLANINAMLNRLDEEPIQTRATRH
jgi:hypothetical protein